MSTGPGGTIAPGPCAFQALDPSPERRATTDELMEATSLPSAQPAALRGKRNWADRIGDPLLKWLSALGALIAVAVIAGIVYEVFHLAWPAITKFGIGFVTT